MKLLLKTPYSVVLFFLALFISALILVSFAYSVHSVYAQVKSIADRVDYEAIMLLQNDTTYYNINESTNQQEAARLAAEKASTLSNALNRLLEDSRVDDAYGVLYALPTPGPRTQTDASKYLMGSIGGALFVASAEFRRSCINPLLLENPDIGDLLKQVSAELGLSSCDERVIRLIDDYVSRLAYVTISTVTQTPSGTVTSGTTRSTMIPHSAEQVFIITSDEGVFESAVKTLLRATNASGLRLSTAALAISLKPEAYVNPASAQATLDRLHRVADELKERIGAALVSTYRADNEIAGYQMMEGVARLVMVFGLVPPLLIVLVAANPIAESIILSMRKEVGLIRLRGAGPGMLRKEFAAVTGVMGVAGFLAGGGVTYAVATYVFGGLGPTIARVTLTDPVILSISAILTAVVLTYSSRKARKVIAELPPTEAIKTTLTPEELLRPLKVGGLGWFSIIVGLYFVVTGYLSWSATNEMLNYMMSTSGPPNIGLFIVLVILSLIESVLKPFAPILLAYGIAKYIAVNYDRLMERVARSGVLGELTFVGKGLIGVMRRRVTAILILTIFTVSVLAQTYISVTANETLMSTAITSSVGNDYSAFIDLGMNSSRNLKELAQELVEKECASYIVLGVTLGAGGGRYPAALAIVTNPDTLLTNSVWFSSWSRPDPFDVAVKRVSGSEVMLIMRKALLPLDLRGLDVGNETNITSWNANTSITATVVEVSDGLPGYSLIIAAPSGALDVSASISSGVVVVAGREMASLLDGTDIIKPMSRVRVIAIGESNETVASCISSIKERAEELGMAPVKEVFINAGELRVSKSLIAGALTFTQSSISITQAIILTGLAIAFSTILSWSVTKEVIRVYLLLRVRGASVKDIAKIAAIKWGFLAAVSVALGLFVGGALGRGAIAPAALGYSLISLPATTPDGITIPIYLGQGLMNPYIPAEGWAIIAATAALLTLFPLAITTRVFLGAVRERFIEVR